MTREFLVLIIQAGLPARFWQRFAFPVLPSGMINRPINHTAAGPHRPCTCFPF